MALELRRYPVTTTLTDERIEEAEPRAQCGAVSYGLWELGFDHEPCDREVGHPGFCVFEARGPLP